MSGRWPAMISLSGLKSKKAIDSNAEKRVENESLRMVSPEFLPGIPVKNINYLKEKNQ